MFTEKTYIHQILEIYYSKKLLNKYFIDPNFFKTMAAALVDFTELTCQAPIQFLLEVSISIVMLCVVLFTL